MRLAHWREARQWWIKEPYLEFHSYVDSTGVKRTERKKRATLGDIRATELDFRFERIRDEAAAAASGNLAEKFYERSSSEMRAMARASLAIDDREAESPIPMRRLAPPKEGLYAPLHLLTGYAFGRSTIPVEEMATMLMKFGLSAAAISDPFSLVGAMSSRGSVAGSE